MIMHGPISQGPVHNSWKLKTSQFFHGLHAHPLSMFWMLWIDMYDSIQQLGKSIEEEWDNIPQATINSLINSM
jgi:hypothetical protein